MVSLINTDAKRFQNRIDAYSEDSKNRIVNAYKAGTFDWSKFDPITIWNDPKNGLWYVLSGHSRLAAFKEIAPLTKRVEYFTRIPVRKFKGTEAEAVDFALNSNTLSTKETEVERALYYNKARQTCELKKDSGAKSDCEKQIKEKVRDSEGKNANYILNLSYLNPNGYLIESLTRLGVEKDNDDTNQARTIANWIGEARRQWHEITDQHETELAKYLLNGGYGNKAGQFKNKTQFNERLRFAIDKWIGNGSKQNDLLNIANTITQSPSEREWNERLFKAKKELDEAINEHEEKHKKYLYALMDGKIDQKRMDELMKPIVLSVDIARKEYERIRGQKDDVVKSSNAQTSLFGIDDINAQFNKELDLLIKGKLPKNHVFYLGDMSDIFNSLGVKILPIEMPVSRLIRKSNQQNHLFDLPLLKNLPEKLNSPIMVFDSKTVIGSLVVLTELTSSDNNFVVAIELDRTYTIWNKGEIEVNDIRSIYPKDNITDVLNWIEKDNLLLWSNKVKSLDLLAGWRSNYANAAQQIKRCTNIIKNFQNPSVLPEKNGDNKTDALDGVTHKAFGFSKIGETKKAKTYKLGGDLGKFLGEYDRLNYSIVLRGDKGAGKSRLLYQIANLFASKKYSVALFSLEMHKDSSISVGYRDSYISKANMKRIDISGESPTFSELDAVCKLYDVVAIDSWTKLKNISQDDFDRLQKLNPRTIIISVFQSTTGKVTRGGNMPEFDASIVIHVHSGGVAKCEKNRYADTRQDYSVFAKKLIEIEEEEVA